MDKRALEILALLDVVRARIDGGPETSEQWAVVVQQLGETRDLVKLEMEKAERREGREDKRRNEGRK